MTCDCTDDDISTTASISDQSSSSKSKSDKSSLSDEANDSKSGSGSTPERSTSNSSTNGLSTSGSSNESKSTRENSPGGHKKKRKSVAEKYNSSNLKYVRIYYGVAVGEFRWKVTCVSLKLDQEKRRIKVDKGRKNKINPEVMDNGNEENSPDNQNNIDSNGNKVNNVLNWIQNVSFLIDGTFRVLNIHNLFLFVSFSELKRPKKLLIFINPFGGKKLAPKIFKHKVEPLLKLSGINYSAVITEHANHARDMLQNVDLPLKDFDGFICIGGDGMFAELINGIVIRTQLEQELITIDHLLS